MTKECTVTYVKADQCKAPRNSWTLIQVLVDQGASDEKEGRWSLAVGEWEGERRLAARWNGTDERPAGNPQSRGIATWFVLPPEFEAPLMSIVPADKLALARALLTYKMFNAENVDVDTNETMATLTILNQTNGFEVTLPRAALEGLQKRIAHALQVIGEARPEKRKKTQALPTIRPFSPRGPGDGTGWMGR